jgi:hypothetical protein
MPFLRKYNTLTVTGTTAIRIPIIKRGVVDFAVSADWTPAAGDVKIAIDGAAAANVTNLPTAVAMGNGAYWEFILTAAELTCKSCVITVADSATKAVEDQAFIVETFGHASAMYQADLSAANLPANVTQLLGTAWLTPAVAGTPDVNATQFAGQTITAAAGVTIPSSIASPTNITAGTITTVTTLTGHTPQTGDSFARIGALGAGLTLLAPAATALSTAVWTATIANRIDVAVSTRLAPLVAGRDLSVAATTGAVELDSADKATLVDLIWDEPLTGATHNVATSSGKRLRQTTAFQQIDSTVIDASATTTTFVTGLTSSVDNFYNDSMLVFTDGALAGQVRAIYDYIGATKTIVLEEALTSAPVNGVAFAIVSLHIHPVSQIQAGLATSAALVTLRGADNDTLKTLSDQIDTVSADVSSIASVSREAF